MVLPLVVIAHAVLSAAGVSLDDGACAAALAARPSPACAGSERGVVLAESPARADHLLAAAEAGAARFEVLFGRPPGTFAIVEADSPTVDTATTAALRQAGFKTILPWLSSTGYRAQIEAGVRGSVASQTAGLDEAERQAAVATALARVAPQLDPARRATTETVAIPHELGHDWYRKAFWPDEGTGNGEGAARVKHYGGPGPDWMDETAAVMLETDASLQDRRKMFGERYRALRASPSPTTAESRLTDLIRFLEEDHPGAEAVRAVIDRDGAAVRSGTAIRVLSGDDARRVADQGLRFYLQAVVFNDYLVETSGDPQILARIGEAFGRGETLRDWLSRDTTGRLPDSVSALDADWKTWIEARHGQAPL